MVNMNLGSIATEVQNRIENVPVSLSGATMMNIADQSRVFMETFINASIGSTAIVALYQPALIDLTASQVLRYMELQGVDVSSIKLGDLSISKGAASAASTVSTALRQEGMRKLAEIGHDVRFFQAL